MNEIYLMTSSLRFWWEMNDLVPRTESEDVWLFTKDGDQLVEIGEACICSKAYLTSDTSLLMQDEPDYAERIMQFYQNDKITFYFAYDEPADKDFYEVPFNAPSNTQGIKPSYVEIWHPADSLNVDVLLDCAGEFCKSLLKIESPEFYILNRMNAEEAKDTFDKFAGEEPNELYFSETVIDELSAKWNMKKQELAKILHT